MNGIVIEFLMEYMKLVCMNTSKGCFLIFFSKWERGERDERSFKEKEEQKDIHTSDWPNCVFKDRPHFAK